ncbi:3'-5' exonuclease (plasmid) [Rhizobium leguminosarum]|uniref:3'-5' exonuclease n=1 Tax=Rhizobium leguminosarum TaxID=384 RepID=UPI0013E3D8DC|nr:ATP-dependent helicase [Rhizobium leguminosarum]QIO63392.1 ATP-dependent helicase [Rhizobium leguminosarum bv. trifolii]
MLIGEVIPELYRYLSTNPLAAEKSEFSHVLVDEFQDLNKAEQGILELLSGAADVCIVGDDDQSIYSFKHAHPEGIRDWLLANVGATDLGLADCQRCPTRVVEMANALIAHNVQRPVPRVLNPLPAKGPGDVRIIQYVSLNAEVTAIVTMIQQMMAAGTPARDILVLAQSRAIGTPIFQALQATGVPARSEYTESELESLVAQRAFALLKLLADQNDRVALRWLVGSNNATFNAAGYRRVRGHCELTGLSPWEVLSRLSAGTLTLPFTGPIMTAFDEVTADLAVLAALPDVPAVVDFLFPAGQNSTLQIRTTATGMLAANPAVDLQTLVSELVTAITQPEIPSDVQEVRIMSLHKSKGLSSPVTIVAGCVNGLLPRPVKSPVTPAERLAHDEEQRRLFYVGITRVKSDPANGKPGTLILTYSQQMPMADAMRAGISPAYSSYGIAVLQASPYIAEMAPAAPAAIAG